MKNMTAIGVENLLERVKHHAITPPDDLDVVELTAWLRGYSECYSRIITMIMDISKGDERD